MRADDSVASCSPPTFEQIYTEYRRPLLSVIGRFIGCPSEREDVLHDVFIRVHRALPRFRGDSSMFTWLYRIAVNTSLNHLRRQSSRVNDAFEPDESVPEAVTVESPEALAIAQQSEAQVAAVMAQLDWVNKDAFLLYSRIGLTYEAIADLLHCPVGTVRSRISRTRLSLRHSLDSVNSTNINNLEAIPE